MAQRPQHIPVESIAHVRSPVAKAKTRRRQFRSCDQCRKGKRACDIVVPRGGISEISDPCSNCSRTGKGCTLEWLKSKSEGLQDTERRTSEDEIIGTPLEHHSHGRNTCDRNENEEVFPTFGEIWDPPLSPSLYLYQQNSDIDPSVWSGSSNGATAVSTQTQEFPPHDLMTYDFDLNTTLPMADTMPIFNGAAPDSFNNGLCGSDMILETTQMSELEHSSKKSRSHFGKRSRRYSMPASSRKQDPRNSKRRPSFQIAPPRIMADPSSASLEYRLASSTNKSFISGNLLKIYHDSMENALSCWLTEKTCPYDVEVQPYVSRIQSKENPMAKEWGSLWSNRICERVCNLDRACGSLRGRPLSRAEDNAVDMALRKTIMSFATQWAYSSNRSAAEFPSNSGSNCQADRPSEFDDEYQEAAYRTEFDRSMQEMMWHEAKSSLQDTADLTSFRLVFANIIFALIQRPRDISESLQKLKIGKRDFLHNSDEEEPSVSSDGPPRNFSSFGPDSTSDSRFEKVNCVQPTLDRVLDLEGPPIFLERALRQMFSYRCKLEKLESLDRTNMKKDQSYPNKACGPLDVANRQTFNLLFWLAIMFDTLSAAINKRPLVVSDEDSDILRDDDFPSTQSNIEVGDFRMISPREDSFSFDSLTRRNESELWGEFFLRRGSLRPDETIPRWPCSHEVAASTLCDAAPIKVVLFRRVTRLQTLLSRRTGAEKLEIAIGEALMVHDYWNTKYGPFFRDCISYHETLPPRIQSWYIVLAGHWHLAGLLLADLIEDIDDQQLGSEIHRGTRGSKRLVENLRLHNSFAISDLGRCSCPRPHSSFSRAREFHSAVNNGALLTEPWTEVLIQSFSKACSVLLDMFPGSRVDNNFNVELFTDRCESCVKALWYLGKKSDIALLASSVLSDALKESVERLEKNRTSRVGKEYDGNGHFEMNVADEWESGDHIYNPLGTFVNVF